MKTAQVILFILIIATCVFVGALTWQDLQFYGGKLPNNVAESYQPAFSLAMTHALNVTSLVVSMFFGIWLVCIVIEQMS